MGLSSELISQFAKVAAKKKETPKESTVNGTVVYDGRLYVRLDGSDLLTPVSTTSSAKDGDRVSVLIKNHSATITGNATDPSASSALVTSQGDILANKIDASVVIADYATIKELTAEKARIDTLETTTLTAEEIEAVYATIETLEADYATIERLESDYATIETLEAGYATIDTLDAYVLNATYGEFQNLVTRNFTAANGRIEDLETNTLKTKDAEILYANVDFANIGELAVEKFFAVSGMIQNASMAEGHVTGDLYGVRIHGDLIDAGTIQADKLIVKGEDGLYYHLNVDVNGVEPGESFTKEELQNGIHGTVILAQSITADKIRVTDLEAFGATIGGFKLTDHSIYSGVKGSVDNTTRGVYMDSDGQMALGDASNFIKYYKDATSGKYKLEITAETIRFGTSGKSVEETIESIEVGSRNLIRNSATMIFSDYYFYTQTLCDEDGNTLLDENGDMLLA